VEFVGVRGVSELSDIAIDNLQITAGACSRGIIKYHIAHTVHCKLVHSFQYLYSPCE